MSKSKWNEVMDLFVKENYEKITTKKIIEELGVSTCSFYNRLKKLNIQSHKSIKRKQSREILKDTNIIDNIVLDYLTIQGCSTYILSEKYNISDETIRKILIDVGIERHHRNHWRKNKDRSDEVNKKHSVLLKGIPGTNRKYYFDFNFFDNIDTEEKAYVLGFFFADGHVSYDNNQITFRLAEKDEEILTKIANAMGAKDVPIRKNYINNRGCVASELGLSSIELCISLIKLGISSNKTYNLEIPISYIPTHLERHLIRGMIDGDGTIHITNRGTLCMGYGCASENPVKYVLDKFKEISGTTTSYRTIKEPYYKSPFYTFRLNSFIAFKCLEWIYEDSTIFLGRKKDLYLRVKENPPRKGNPYEDDIAEIECIILSMLNDGIMPIRIVEHMSSEYGCSQSYIFKKIMSIKGTICL
jgi:hypothetical protein